MSIDKADVAAGGSFITMVVSGVAQLNDIAAEYLPLVTLLGAITGIAALFIKVWQVKVQRTIAQRNRALEHKRMEHEREMYGRRWNDD